MKNTLRTRVNLSASGLEGIANMILKYERERYTRAMIAMIKTILESGKSPNDWKEARLLLIDKIADRSHLVN
jgi:hypothetical protein